MILSHLTSRKLALIPTFFHPEDSESWAAMGTSSQLHSLPTGSPKGACIRVQARDWLGTQCSLAFQACPET